MLCLLSLLVGLLEFLIDYGSKWSFELNHVFDVLGQGDERIWEC